MSEVKRSKCPKCVAEGNTVVELSEFWWCEHCGSLRRKCKDSLWLEPRIRREIAGVVKHTKRPMRRTTLKRKDSE